jgi:hypothetical protein
MVALAWDRHVDWRIVFAAGVRENASMHLNGLNYVEPNSVSIVLLP